MVPFVDEARPQAQTGGRRHPGTDGAAGVAWPWSKSSQFESDAGWRPSLRLTWLGTRGSWASMRSAPPARSADTARLPTRLWPNTGVASSRPQGTACCLSFPRWSMHLEYALAVQAVIAQRNEGIPQDRRMLLRIGINLGDILIEGDDILGDGVNVAARLEGIAEPGGICISSSAYDQIRGKVAVEFTDLGEQRLKNIARPVRAYAIGPNLKTDRAVPPLSSAPRLSIVVLPFANIGGDPEQEYFVDGVTESLTTDLSRISGAFVIARNTAFTFKGKALDVKKLGRELNVRYVLEGSVQRGGNRLRVNVELIDVETGNHLWAERFDKPVTDLFDMQDEIVSRLANTLNSQLIDVEARRAERSPHPDALDLCFQGAAWANKGLAPENLAQALGFYERALALEPGNVEALVGTALVNFLIGANFFTDDRIQHLTAAEAAVTKALSLAPNHPIAHWGPGPCANVYEPRGSRHRQMRAGAGAGSEFGRGAREHRDCEVSSRSGWGDRSPYRASAPPLSPRYLRLFLDYICRSRQILARRRRRSDCLAAPEP
jgi:TolB-like protein